MYKNLLAEMARHNISRKQIAELIGGSYNHVREKIKGKYEFEYGEAVKIQETFFPDLDLKYLFDR
jgi:hypothetical protein